MPIPHPAKDENKDKFMSRCVGFMHKENNNKPENSRWTNEQMVAICFSQWRRKKTASRIPEDEKKRDEEFMKRFLTKYPQYKSYFENGG